MLNVYICEDNEAQLIRMKKVIEDIIMIEFLDMEVVLATKDPYELLTELKKNGGTGVYFLDVDLQSDITGIALGAQIRQYDPRGFIVLVTTHAEMSYLTFQYKVEALDYIIKDDFEENRDRIKSCIMNINKKFSKVNNETQKCFHVKSGERIIHIDYRDILFFETSPSAHKIIVNCTNRVEEFHSSMKEIENQVDERFLRCHQSFLVNKEHIQEVDKRRNLIVMNNGQKCDISIRGMRLLKSLVK